MKLLLAAIAAGAAAWFLRDRERAGAQLSQLGSKAGGLARQAKGRAGGESRAPAEERLNDPALARKVESELFRDDDVPKDKLSVNAEYGVIYLRGEVPSGEVGEELAKRVRQIDGVRAVENLTHPPGEPAQPKS